MERATDRLRLREFAAEDWAFVHAYQNDPRYQRFYEQSSWDEDSCRDFVSMFLRQQAEQPRTRFQFVLVADGEPIGNCGIRRDAGSDVLGNIGFEIAPVRWGQGFATEAAACVLAMGFEDLGLERVWAECVGENTGSRRVLQKVGMKEEARLRDHLRFRERYWDRMIYGILKCEWEGAV